MILSKNLTYYHGQTLCIITLQSYSRGRSTSPPGDAWDWTQFFLVFVSHKHTHLLHRTLWLLRTVNTHRQRPFCSNTRDNLLVPKQTDPDFDKFAPIKPNNTITVINSDFLTFMKEIYPEELTLNKASITKAQSDSCKFFRFIYISFSCNFNTRVYDKRRRSLLSINVGH